MCQSSAQPGRPADCANRAPEEVTCYDLLDRLGVAYRRADHAAIAEMDGLAEVSRVLDAPICKNLFLCNRQKTQFYLLLMPGDKPFHTKDVTGQLGCARLSFAGEEPMRTLLGVTPGSVSVLGLLHDTENRVHLVIDRDVLDAPMFGCHPCRNTSTLCFSTADLTGKVLPALGHAPTLVTL